MARANGLGIYIPLPLRTKPARAARYLPLNNTVATRAEGSDGTDGERKRRVPLQRIPRPGRLIYRTGYIVKSAREGAEEPSMSYFSKKINES